MAFITGRDVRILDLNAAYFGVPRSTLMEKAGKAVFEEINRTREISKKKIIVYCGSGNNGGDGLVCARYLHEAGYSVAVFITGPPRTPDALANLDAVKDVSPMKKSTFDSEVIVDALLGTGIVGEVREPTKSIINKINASKALIISIDVPSGLGDNGKGFCVKADKVVTFHRSKKGLERFNTVVKDIGIPMKAESHVGPGDLVDSFSRKNDSHKGENGKVLVIGGSAGYHGAPILSALGALNSGADLVHLAVPEGNYDVTRSYAPDFIVKKFPGEYLGSGGHWFPEDKYNSIVMGPGLGSQKETQENVLSLLKNTPVPVVIDADAIKALEGTKLKINGVITPHSKEFQMLSGKKLPKNMDKRKSVLLEESAQKGSVILLKAPVDIIVSPDGNCKFNETGNSGMTVGGTGDVLAGIVGGFIAQGIGPFTAAYCSAFINGAAGDELYSWKGNCFTASDLAYEIPFTIKRMLDFESQ